MFLQFGRLYCLQAVQVLHIPLKDAAREPRTPGCVEGLMLCCQTSIKALHEMPNIKTNLTLPWMEQP